MAEKVDKTPAGALPLLPMSMSERKKKQARAGAAPPLPAVRDVILWTLFHAGIVIASFAFSIAYILIITSISQLPPSWLLPRPVEMTDAEVAMAGALLAGMLWYAVAQAAAGALALMLPRHRRRLRLLLAYTVLGATAVGHSKRAGLNGIFVAADPGGLCFRTGVTTAVIVIFEVGDLICLLGLILHGSGEEEE